MKDDARNSAASAVAGRQPTDASRTAQRRFCHEHGDDCPSENEREFESLEYEEDVYYSNLAATPSFDDIDELSGSEEIIVHCWRDSNGELDDIVVDDTDLCGDADFVHGSDGPATNRRRKRRSIRIVFQEFSKSYLAKITNSQNYKKFLELVKGSLVLLMPFFRSRSFERNLTFSCYSERIAEKVLFVPRA